MLYMYSCMYINICMSRLMVSSISLAPCHFMCAGPVYHVGKRCRSWRIEMVHVSFCHLNNVSNTIYLFQAVFVCCFNSFCSNVGRRAGPWIDLLDSGCRVPPMYSPVHNRSGKSAYLLMGTFVDVDEHLSSSWTLPEVNHVGTMSDIMNVRFFRAPSLS